MLRNSRSDPACLSDVTKELFSSRLLLELGGCGAGLAFLLLCLCCCPFVNIFFTVPSRLPSSSVSSSFFFLCRRKILLMAPSMVKGGFRWGLDCINKVDKRVFFLTCSGDGNVPSAGNLTLGWLAPCCPICSPPSTSSSSSRESLPSSSQHSVVDSALWMSSLTVLTVFLCLEAIDTVGGVEQDSSSLRTSVRGVVSAAAPAASLFFMANV